MSQNPRLESLFAAARDDAPSRAVQDGVWSRVAAKTVATAGAGAAGAATTAGAKVAGVAILPPAAKLLALGAALGATVAGASFVALGPAAPQRSAPPPVVSANAAPPTHAASSRGRDEATAFELPPATESLPSSPSSPSSPSASVPTPAAAVGSLRPATVASEDASVLGEEARFVTEARRALVNGDPEGALVWTRRTRGLPTRALEPEELALEARALRALGRTDEARAADEALRRRFPGHALAH